MVLENKLTTLQGPDLDGAGRLLDEVRGHVLGAPALCDAQDYAGALLLAYEAARKVAVALLLTEGLRVPDAQGGHGTTFDAALLLLTGDAADAMRDASHLRGQRNGNMYRALTIDRPAAQQAAGVLARVHEHAVPVLAAKLDPE